MWIMNALLCSWLVWANPQWEGFKKDLVGSRTQVAVQNRQIVKSNKWQIFGPLVGPSERKDFKSTFHGRLGLRLHFSERGAWEILNINGSQSRNTELAAQVEQETGKPLNTQDSSLQISSSYIWSPIYGKYAWNDKKVIHFDLFGKLGGGLRFADQPQFFVNLGLGTNQYLFSKHWALAFEYNMRIYQEDRGESTLINESLFLAGISWLL